MPTPQLEQNRVCDWIDESHQRVGLRAEVDASRAAAVSALEEAAKGVPYSQMLYMGLHFDSHHTRAEIDPEQDVWELARVARTKFDREYSDKAAALATQLNITRSQLYSKALADFIEKHEDEKLTRAYNEAYKGEMEEEEEQIVRHVKAYHRRRLSAE